MNREFGMAQTVAKRGEGLDPLKRALITAASLPAPARKFVLPADVEDALAPLKSCLVEAGLTPTAAGMEADTVMPTRRPR